MLDSNTKRTINNLRNILVGKVPDPKSQVDQITLALIYKSMYDMDEQVKNLKGKPQFFKEEMKKYSWERIISNSISGEDRVKLYEEALDKFSKEEEFPTFFRDVFKYSTLPYKDPETLRLFVNEINDFNYNNNNNGSDNSEGLGNAFEHLLSYLGSQGDAGQFRTPRHIIDFIVEVVKPEKDEKIFDPACGTAGFLISAFKSIIRENSDNYKEKDYIHSFIREDRSDSESNISQPNGHFDGRNLKSHYKSLYNNIIGYDISPDMVKLSKVNLFLNKFKEPKVEVQDTLSNEGVWGKTEYDVILANPPFMTPRGGTQTHSQFPIPSNRSEVLFVEYIIEHLNHKKGRAGIIVPEGVIFKSDNAYKKLRKMLLEEGGLWAVVSLPSGVFQPYSGVKTSILFLDKKRSKNSEEILFVDVKNDGFDLGANRRKIDSNDLTQAFEDFKKYKKREFKKSSISFLVNKSHIKKDGNYNLNLNLYKPRQKVTSDYPMVKLGDVCELNPKKSEVKDKKKLSVSFLPMADIAEKGTYLSPQKIRKLSEIYSGYTYFSENDVLLAKVTPCFENGKSGIAKNLINKIGFGSSELIVYRSNNKKVIPEFIYYLISKSSFIEKGKEHMTGTGGLKRVTTDFAKNFLIPLPPLSVQKEIVAEVEGYQSIIDGAKQIIDNWKPAFKIDPEWKIVKLGDVIEKVRYPKKIQKLQYLTQGSYPVISQEKEFISGYSDEQKYLFENFPVVLFGDHTRCVKYINFPFCLGADGVKILKPIKGIDCKFFYYCIQKLKIKDLGYSRHFKLLKDKDIPFPPLSVQKEIVEKIQEEEKIVESNKKLIEINQEKITKRFSKLFNK